MLRLRPSPGLRNALKTDFARREADPVYRRLWEMAVEAGRNGDAAAETSARNAMAAHLAA